MDTPKTPEMLPGSAAAIMSDEKNHRVTREVLEALQKDIEQRAKDAGANPVDITFCVWTTLGRVLTVSGAHPGALIATFVATHPEIIAAHIDENDEKSFDGPSIFKTPRSDSIN